VRDQTALVLVEFVQNQSTSLIEKVLLIIKLARPRTWMFSVISYLFAYLSGAANNTNELLLGIGIFALLTGATNMINTYTDREEDRVNNPIRIVWTKQLGLQNLLISTVAIYLTVFCLSFLLGLNFVFVVTIAVFDSIFYSLQPLRFKQHPVTALLAFSGAVAFPFLAGIVVAYNIIDLTNPFFVLFSVFMFAYGTVKNIPDYLGDKIAGLKTTTTAFESYRMAIRVSTAILLTPYALLGYMVLSESIAMFYLLNLPLMIFPLFWGYSNLRTTKREISEKIHTYGFIYAISFLLFNLVLTYPTIHSIVVSVCVYSIIYLINKYEIDSRKKVPLSSTYLESSYSALDMTTSRSTLDTE
jgi:4-hydroxybenzoate polyprenyltransferase